MSIAQATHQVHPGAEAAETVLDGLIAGTLGALAVALWFLLVDALHGRPLYTPALLGSVLLHGHVPADPRTFAALDVAAYTAFHFVAFMAAGMLFSFLMSLFERFPIVFFVLTMLLVVLQVGFVGALVALGMRAPGDLPAWAAVVAILLATGAMAGYLGRRHRRARAQGNPRRAHAD